MGNLLRQKELNRGRKIRRLKRKRNKEQRLKDGKFHSYVFRSVNSSRRGGLSAELS